LSPPAIFFSIGIGTQSIVENGKYDLFNYDLCIVSFTLYAILDIHLIFNFTNIVNVFIIFVFFKIVQFLSTQGCNNSPLNIGTQLQTMPFSQSIIDIFGRLSLLFMKI